MTRTMWLAAALAFSLAACEQERSKPVGAAAGPTATAPVTSTAQAPTPAATPAPAVADPKDATKPGETPKVATDATKDAKK